MVDTNKLKVYYKARKIFLSFFYFFVFGEGEEGLEDEHILPLVLKENIHKDIVIYTIT